MNEHMDINKLYSPSYWCKRYPQPLVVENHIKEVTEASNESRTKVPFERNVKYGDKESWTMDVYGTNLPRDSPVFVYIHGGYWQSLNKDISAYMVEPFYKAGIKVIIPEYTLAPEARLDEIIEQIKSFGLHLLQEASIWGTSSVWIGGHSAGAHLAASLLDSEWYWNLEKSLQAIFKGLVLISGLFDLTPIIQTEYNAALNLSKTEAETYSPLKKSLLKKINSNFMVLLAVAENDSPAFQEQTFQYNKFLNEQKVRTCYLFLKDLDHFDIVENLKDENFLLTKKIIELVKESK